MRIVPVLALLSLLPYLAGCAANVNTWDVVDKDALTETENTQYTAAVAARDELAKTLMGRLTEGMQTGGAPAAISVCKDVAPKIAADISQTKGLHIGRTSFRLRNPENTAPSWAASYMEARHAEPLVLRNPDTGALATLFPIKLQAQCLQCHGPEELIAPVVRDALKAAYPEDKAMGFNDGDLRGWFHITVPAAT
jgi:hypothetical protein